MKVRIVWPLDGISNTAHEVIAHAIDGMPGIGELGLRVRPRSGVWRLMVDVTVDAGGVPRDGLVASPDAPALEPVLPVKPRRKLTNQELAGEVGFLASNGADLESVSAQLGVKPESLRRRLLTHGHKILVERLITNRLPEK